MFFLGRKNASQNSRILRIRHCLKSYVIWRIPRGREFVSDFRGRMGYEVFRYVYLYTYLNFIASECPTLVSNLSLRILFRNVIRLNRFKTSAGPQLSFAACGQSSSTARPPPVLSLVSNDDITIRIGVKSFI